MSNDTQQVPKSALNFTVGEFVLGDNGDGAKSAPFRMVARSGKPIDHWYWGSVVHDLSGMRAKGRIPIDYAHDEREVIGYANHFSTDDGDLEVSGALVPYKESDKASEVIFKSKAGVPYEASINFGGDGIRVERLSDGAKTTVNGYELTGPATIIRSWPLRGVAVCPYGADSNTSTSLKEGDTITVEIEDAEMPEEALVKDPDQQEDNQPVEEAREAVESTDTVDIDNAEVAEAQPATVEAELTSHQTEGARFLEAFGDRGGVWFAQGKSFDEATQLFIAEVVAERDDLRQKLSASQGLGEQEPVSFVSADQPKKTRAIRIMGKVYD